MGKARHARTYAPSREPAPARPESRAPSPPAAPQLFGPGNLKLVQASASAAVEMAVPGPPNAPEEHAADRLSKEVLGAPVRTPCACGGVCAACKARSGGATARGLSRNPAPAPGGPAPFGPGSGRALDLTTRSLFEPRFGTSLDHVRVHADRQTSRQARRMDARAFALGSRIGFAEGEYSPSTPAGRAVLAHELSHVALGHRGLRRLGGSPGADDRFLESQRKIVTGMVEADRAKKEQHESWSKALEKHWSADLTEQSKDLGAERDRISLLLSGAQAKAFDEAGKGTGWLAEALKAQGYDGPSIADVKRMWGQALVAADAIKLSAAAEARDPGKPTLTAETKLNVLATISDYYAGAKLFSEAAEAAHRKHVDEENKRAAERYRQALASYRSDVRADKASYGPRGEPGEGAARASQAILRGSPPSPPEPIIAPAAVSGTFAGATDRISGAKTTADWEKVAADVRSSAGAVGRLVVASLPGSSAVAQQAAGLDALDQRLKGFAESHAQFWRIPAVFYPMDATSSHTDAGGNQVVIPDAMPWQFYLTHTARIDQRDGMCIEAGEWVLTDLSNPKGGENRVPSDKGTAEKIEKGEKIDPPIGLFTPLNSKLRFPEGELYFTLPSGKAYVHHMTEPWSASDWLSAFGLAFAAVALVAGVVATGGAAAPAAIAFGATLASAGFGIAGTLQELREKSEHGLLTEKDKDRAMIDIGLNVLSVATLGLGRVVAAPGAALRFGAKFGTMTKALKALRVANLIGDIAQVGLVTSELVEGFQAIKDNPNLSENERDKLIGQLVRRALLTGAMMTLAIKGDVSELRSGGNLHISHVGEDGVPVAGKAHEVESAGMHAHVEGGVKSAPHERVTGETHASAETHGTGLDLAGNRHAVGVSGAGPTRDIYFCSDFCTSMVNKLTAVLEAMPAKHPMRPAFEGMLKRARTTRSQLQAGKIDDAAAQQVGAELRAQIGRLTQDSHHGPTLSNLLDMSPEILSAQADDISKGISRGLDIHAVRADAEAKFTPAADQPHSLADLASGKRPRSWIVAPDSVMDAETRRILTDFDQRIAGTGGIEKISAVRTKDGGLGVTVSGTVEPGKLTRNPDRVGMGPSLAPSFNSRARNLLGRLQAGWQRLHLWGPGFGDEAAAGMMVGPSSVNLRWQNGDLIVTGGKKSYMGIEGFIRELGEAAKESGGKLRLTAKAESWGNPTPGGYNSPLGEPVLRNVDYHVEIVDAAGNVTSRSRVSLSVPDPATWKSPYTVQPRIEAVTDGKY